VRRFRCAVPECGRVTFVEDCGAELPRAARRTQGVSRLLRELALAMGGEAGARLAQAAGMPVSPDTRLRLVRNMAEPTAPAPRVLGVDDFAFRRGCRYGTILIDMEPPLPIDLLDGRDAATLAAWLREHPGVEIIVRDRAGAYAEGAKAGAPDAVQVADRFHLVQNAGVALEEVLRSRRRRTEWLPAAGSADQDDDVADLPANEPAPPSPTQRQRAERRALRIARWEEIRRRYAAGENISQIARGVGKGRKTVRRYLATAAPPPVPHVIKPRPAGLRSPTLQPFASYLQDRWQAGWTNARRLYRELVERGYTGSYSLVRAVLQPWRPPRQPRRGRRQRVSVRWLCLRPCEQLSREELAVREQILADDPELVRACTLRDQFRDLIRARDVGALDDWLQAAHASELPPFESLANGLERDRAAVEAALTTEWSNGPVEGHVHRLKLIKRQGYGRAKLDLLRSRVIAA
jgi:transposase